VIATPHDIRSLIADAVEAFQPVTAARHVALAVEVPNDPIVALYDHHRIFQVLSNLMHNAFKFTPKGGSICVRVEPHEAECIVSVSDTGIGIPKNELRSVFEQFRQLDAGDRLGLGLYISLLIVEAHDGRIWAESEVGAGTTISFTLPREIAARAGRRVMIRGCPSFLRSKRCGACSRRSCAARESIASSSGVRTCAGRSQPASRQDSRAAGFVRSIGAANT
jgi:signal transduction histidine kinase